MSGLPRVPEAERQLVSALVIGTDAIEEAAAVRPTDLVSPHSQAIWEAGWNLRDLGRPITIPALEEQLRIGGHWDSIGVTGLMAYDSDRTMPWEVRDAARAVRKASQLRQICEVAGELRDVAHKGDVEDADALLAEYAYRLELLAQGKNDERITLGEAMHRRIDQAKRESEGERHRIPTGLGALDEELRGGWRPTWQVVVGAAKKVGKSALALTAARAAARRGHPVLFFSAEMEAIEQGERAIAAESDIPMDALDRGPRDTEWASIVAAAERARRYPFEIVDRGVELDRLVAIARRWRRHNKTKPGLVVVDYLQLVDVQSQRGVTREQEVARISRRLKLLAVELGCTTLVLAQLNGRKIADRKDKRPIVEDLRESGSIEADANLVLLLNRPWLYDTSKPPAVAEITIGAFRHGPFPRLLHAVFAPKTASFHDTN